MSSELYRFLFYAILLIDAVGGFLFFAFPRIRKLLACKEKAEGIVESVVETKNAKGQPLFHSVVRYQAGLSSCTCKTEEVTKGGPQNGEPVVVYYQASRPENAFVKNSAFTGRLLLGFVQPIAAAALAIFYYIGTH